MKMLVFTILALSIVASANQGGLDTAKYINCKPYFSLDLNAKATQIFNSISILRDINKSATLNPGEILINLSVLNPNESESGAIIELSDFNFRSLNTRLHLKLNDLNEVNVQIVDKDYGYTVAKMVLPRISGTMGEIEILSSSDQKVKASCVILQ